MEIQPILNPGINFKPERRSMRSHWNGNTFYSLIPPLFLAMRTHTNLHRLVLECVASLLLSLLAYMLARLRPMGLGSEQ
jgi:hypothetical protein